ncbi:efflux RND transporter periplasmic adaptor subunit [Mycoplana rhizolycopersici]|uniref:Efflux RND transporter periplasmic adaptor subunit n=1 Tax=Mycoplana rhizolycopersici TaxID=2746702 RepID=A0ABX2QL56_9HYPH|nr:efflux RND transporter periplasmic adaptor subunit [Rhizobium rhizolycopersici]NVP58477.1 efflux RND transporter periplasmic adaptor subunit [Rhizobium rhizolycopersici]
MNTHFDIAAEQGRKLAETLKSLSLEPLPRDRQLPKPMLRRLVLPACLSALVVGAAAGAVLYRSDVLRHVDAALSEPERATVDLVAVTKMEGERSAARNPLPVDREVTGSGFVVAPDTTTVFAKYEGRITQIAVVLGDRVEAGQILVTLEDAGARFALEQASAAKVQAGLILAARDIDLAQAGTVLDRTEILAARNATSRQALEDARAAAERASNAVAQARQSADSADLAIRIAEERVAELTVRAPFAGTVTRLDARVGDTVLARIDSVRESQSLLTIANTKSLAIDADVAETTIAALKPGLLGQAVLDGFPDQPFAVRLLRLAPVASVEKGTVTLHLSLDDPPDGILPNMAARIRIALDETGENPQ